MCRAMDGGAPTDTGEGESEIPPTLPLSRKGKEVVAGWPASCPSVGAGGSWQAPAPASAHDIGGDSIGGVLGASEAGEASGSGGGEETRGGAGEETNTGDGDRGEANSTGRGGDSGGGSHDGGGGGRGEEDGSAEATCRPVAVAASGGLEPSTTPGWQGNPWRSGPTPTVAVAPIRVTVMAVAVAVAGRRRGTCRRRHA